MHRKRLSRAAAARAVALVALGAMAPLISGATAQQQAAPAQTANRPVIILMKNRLSGAAAAKDQAPLLDALQRAGARRVRPFHMVNALAVTVSEETAARLRANPAVDRVIPDSIIHRRRAKPAQAAAVKGSAVTTSTLPNPIPGACGTMGQVQLEPEALQTTNTDADDQAALTARSLHVTGAGVVVAYIADGIDPTNINFTRADSSQVFIGTQDFSGDGLGQATTGSEAFIDANAIAGQGIQVYDISSFGAQTSQTVPCNIRIEGVAPGASLIGLDVFGESEDTTTSSFLQAIDYAINQHVDVLNESFGSSVIADTTTLDAIKQFNDTAVTAGITVTVSSGDAGPTNTIGSPASDPAVINVGASTTFRFYAQTNYAAAAYFASTGWLNDNISALSSGGFTQTGTTVDLVAPGDLGFASCTATAQFTDCLNLLGESSNVERSGGTSMSAPLTAGAAALVIEAYRDSHSGASPSPALVKQILTSTATDIGAPASQQGAGLLNSYKAVLLAQSIPAGDVPQTPMGQSLLLAVTQPSPALPPNAISVVDEPSKTHSWEVTVTNAGFMSQSVQLSGRTFTAAANLASGTVTLSDPHSAKLIDFAGIENNYATFSFKMPAGVNRLNASIAYPGEANAGQNARVRLILVDPQGRFAAHSAPQGVGNFGNVAVRAPAAGTWTGVIFGVTEDLGNGEDGTNGVVHWQVTTQHFAKFGTVTPSKSVTLQPGGVGQFSFTAATPAAAGDEAGAIIVTSSAGGTDSVVGAESNSIPVTLRSMVKLAKQGSFSGTVTGGNGRSLDVGQVLYYQFVVPAATTSLAANLTLANDPTDPLFAYLIGPSGTVAGLGTNTPAVNGGFVKALTVYTTDPAPGIWTLAIDVDGPVVGNELSLPFTGTIVLDGAKVTATGLPDKVSTMLPANTPLHVPVKITNSSASPQAFFIDARLDTTATNVPLQQVPGSTGATGIALPITVAPPSWLVPTRTSSVQVIATATVPVEFDFEPASGDPDLGSTTGSTATGSYATAVPAVFLQQGPWFVTPDEIGPFADPATSATVSIAFTGTMLAFDPAVTSTTGDAWLNPPGGGNPANPLLIAPGKTGTIIVTITPSGSPNTVVTGHLFVSSYVGLQTEFDEVADLPYSYTIE